MRARGRNPNTNAVPPAPPPPVPGYWLPSTHGTKLLTWFGSGGWSRLPSLSLYHGGNNLSPACPTYRNAHKRGGAFDVTTESGAQDIKKEKGQPGQDLAGRSGPGHGRRLRSGVFHPQRFENEFSVNKEKGKNTIFSFLLSVRWRWTAPLCQAICFSFLFVWLLQTGSNGCSFKTITAFNQNWTGKQNDTIFFLPSHGTHSKVSWKQAFFLNTLRILINPNCCH